MGQVGPQCVTKYRTSESTKEHQVCFPSVLVTSEGEPARVQSTWSDVQGPLRAGRGAGDHGHCGARAARRAPRRTSPVATA